MTDTFLVILYVSLLYCNQITDMQQKKQLMTVCNLGIVTKHLMVDHRHAEGNGLHMRRYF